MRMLLHKNREVRHFLACLFLCLGLGACQTQISENKAPLSVLEQSYKADMTQTILHLDELIAAKDVEDMRKSYKTARNLFKRLEPIMGAVDRNNLKSVNAPNILKIEEEDATDIRITNPFGFQVIEETLFEEEVDTAALFHTARITRNRLQLMKENVRILLDEEGVLWMIRDGFVRIATTGITGFDSPMLANSLEESSISYEVLGEIIELHKGRFQSDSLYQAWQQEIAASRAALTGDFDSFDRYSFIKDHTQKQMKLWVATVQDWGIDYSLEMALRNDATSLFSKNTFNLRYFADYRDNPYDQQKVTLGRKLFNDTGMSKDGKMSCGTCHQKDKAFTDGKKVFPNQKRNTPTVTYAALQKGFFYDMRAGSLEGQIVSVVENKDEFHADLSDLPKMVARNAEYKAMFDSLYEDGVTQENIRNAMATYIRDLSPFNSKFDKNMNGQENTLTKDEITGFNIFMGKGSCATCHFPPTFNGTVPPFYAESEMELLGTPKNNDGKPIVDTDWGRYDLYQTEERKHFFKTPTVRNIAKTAPYMHNGVYPTLDEVMAFYNHGGGAGMGMDLPLQTLPADSLHLSNKEMQQVIAFMKTLTDSEDATDY